MKRLRPVLFFALVLASAVRGGKPGQLPVPSTRDACLAAGGAWDDLSGRGHVHGCNLPTSDGGKTCTDSKECEGACKNGFCSDHREVRGCGIMTGGQKVCVD